MRKAAIDVSKVSLDVCALAGEQIGAALAAGQKILCFGHPPEVKPSDPTATTAVLATCTECDIPIYSTELKEMILHIAPDCIQICCMPCFMEQMKKAGEGTTISAVVNPNPNPNPNP
jgi:hypothetical protein